MTNFINFLPSLFWVITGSLCAIVLVIVNIMRFDGNVISKISYTWVASLVCIVGLLSLVMSFKAPKNLERHVFIIDEVAQQMIRAEIDKKVNERIKELSANYKYAILAEGK